MSFRPCVSGWGRFLAPFDSHKCRLTCLDFQHAEDESCTYCGRMTIKMLRSRLDYLSQGRVPSAIPRSSSTSLADGQGDLRVTVWAFPTRPCPRATHPFHTSQAIELPDEIAGPARQGSSISFGALADDQVSIAAS